MKFTSMLACAAVMTGLMNSPSTGAVKYWDLDGATPGPGGTPQDGIWDLDTTANWSTSAAGDTDSVVWSAGDEAVFSSGTDPFDAAVTMQVTNSVAPLNPASVTIENGRLILTLGGTSANTQLLIGSNPIRVNQGGTLQLSTNLAIAAGLNHILTLDGGTLRNTVVGVGSGIYTSPAPSATQTPTRIELTANGGTLDTPNGGYSGDIDDPNSSYSIMVYGSGTSAAVIGMSPGTTSATLRKTGHGEFRALTNYTFTELDVQQGLYRINGTGGGETGFGAATGTVRTAGGAVENSTNGSALGTSFGLTAANASPATRSFVLGTSGGTPDTMFVMNASWEINGPISGAGGLMLNGWARNDASNGTGTTNIIGTQTPLLTLGGTNTYAGKTTINFGTVAAKGGNAVPNTSEVVFSTRSVWGSLLGGTPTTFDTAVLRVDASETVGSISGGNATRGVVNINGAAVVLSTGADNSSTTFDGKIQGTGGLTKVGTGTFTMNGTNTYAGDTHVNGGTLSSSIGTSLADLADVYLTTGSLFNLNFAGPDTIDSLFIDGVGQAAGTWGSLASSATNKTALITGTGLLQVTTAPTPTNNADFNNDNKVDGADFLIWQGGFGLTGQPNKSTGDANGDQLVDGTDFQLWKDKFGGPPAEAAAAGVPEPASVCLVGMALAALAGVRRRSA